MKHILKHCKYCGADAEQPDWDACMEMSTGAWQSCTIRCSTRYCMADVNLTIAPDEMKTGDSFFYEQKLVDLWNEMMDEK